MKITIEIAGGDTVLILGGPLTFDEDQLLNNTVVELVRSGHRSFVLDMKGVPYFDSAGFGELLRTHSAVSQLGGSLRIRGVRGRVRTLLSIAKLLGLFEDPGERMNDAPCFGPGPHGPTGARSTSRANANCHTCAAALRAVVTGGRWRAVRSSWTIDDSDLAIAARAASVPIAGSPERVVAGCGWANTASRQY